jgi:hypothetical protein
MLIWDLSGLDKTDQIEKLKQIIFKLTNLIVLG